MALLYRAVWDDDWCQPVALLDDEFRSWCCFKGIPVDDVPARGVLDLGGRHVVEVRRADAEIGKALRCRLSEIDPRGRTWTTTATALHNDGVRTFWVDLDCEDPTGGRPEMAAPRLARGLIDGGGRPMIFGQQLRTDAYRIPLTKVPELLAVLHGERGRVPVVVFSPDMRAGPKATIERADAAAAALAGVAHVYVLDPPACAQLERETPSGFRVYGGAVRLYLPDIDFDDPDDAHRHRWISARLIADHPRRAATLLAGRLARLKAHQPIPDAWAALEPLLRRPSDVEVGERAAQIATSRPDIPAAADVDALLREIDDLTKLLAAADLVHEAENREAGERISRLEREAKEAEDERYDDADELEELRHERDVLQQTIRAIADHRPDAQCEEIDPFNLPIPSSIDEAVELGRSHLRRVVIPDAALRDIDELEASAKYAVWASAIWQGLLALDAYACLKADGAQPPGFKLWCEESNAWPPTKLAMTESDRVQNDAYLRGQRRFPVDVGVDPAGRIEMFAHLKIQAGGGNNIPRLYFFDDTDGQTGCMHVGFIGPHRLVRNTKS